MKTTLNPPRCRLNAELGWSDPRFDASAFFEADTTGPRVRAHENNRDRWISVAADMPRSADEPVRGRVTLHLSFEHARKLAEDILAALPSEDSPTRTCMSCLGHGKLLDADGRENRKCLDCRGTGEVPDEAVEAIPSVTAATSSNLLAAAKGGVA